MTQPTQPLNEQPSSSPVEEAPADVAEVLARLRSWDHCYPGNINIEMAMGDAERVITRLSADLAEARKVIEEVPIRGANAARVWLSQQGDQS